MKKTLLFSVLSAPLMLGAQLASGQTPEPDQNPDFMVSRAKYMAMADSVNSLHSTTPQETYKAIDYLEDKREARELRKAERRERARYGYNYYGYDYPAYYDPYYYYNSRSRFLWNAVPLTLSLGYHRYHPYHRHYRW